MGQSGTGPASEGEQRPPDLGARGLCIVHRPKRRAPGRPFERRSGHELSDPRVRPRRQRLRDPSRDPPRPRRARQGQLRAGQQPQPGPPEPPRRRPRISGPVVPPPRTRQPGGRGARRPRATGQGRTAADRPEASQILRGRQGPGSSSTEGRRGPLRHGGSGLRQSPAAGCRPRRRLRVAPGPSPGKWLESAQGQRVSPRRPGSLLRQGGLGRGPLQPGRHRQ